MLTIFGHLAGALGLFFMGAKLLTQHLKTLTNRRLRLSAAHWTRNRFMGFAWGLVAGSVLQSITVVTLVVVSLLKSDLVSPKRAFPILLGGNLGGSLLVLIVMLDVKVLVLYVLGIAYFLTLLLARDRASRYQAMATACFGLALMAFGSIMLKESVLPLADFPWFQQAMIWMSGSLFLPLLSGMVLTVAAQGLSRWVPVAAALGAVLTGTSGADTLTGTSDGELLVGLGGADTLSGQGGDDELRGGEGDDTYTGGAGRDRFVFFSGETGAKAITDFASGDVIVLKGSGWSSVGDIIAGVQAIGTANYRYTLASGLTVETTNNRSLRTEDFLLE